MTGMAFADIARQAERPVALGLLAVHAGLVAHKFLDPSSVRTKAQP